MNQCEPSRFSNMDIANFIGGELVPAQRGLYLDNFQPATGLTFSRLPDSDSEDVYRAIEAAENAYEEWTTLGFGDRAHFLRKIAAEIDLRKEEFALAESIDTGKPVSVARSIDITRSIKNFEFYADLSSQLSTECHVTHQAALNYTLRSSLGPVACISPWNLPLYLLTWKIAPALAFGNTVVAKPSEITPLTAYLLSQVCVKVGLPPGVLNIVHGLGSKVGSPLVQHAHIKAVSFTGSTQTGAEIARLSAPSFKKISLEMGGKNPTVIFSDANFDEALEGALRAAFSNQGQICLCGSRILVERSLYPKFKSALIDRTRSLKVGDPLESQTDQGAVASQAHFEKIMSYIDLAKKEGGEILTGGHRVNLNGRCQNGWFIAPTLVEGLSSSCRTNQEEIFGPFATIAPFETDQEALNMANHTSYGLSASLWTRDITRAHRFSAKLRAGMVWVNTWMLRDLRTPFGGVGASGVGREGGMESYRFFTEPKNVCIKTE